MVVIIAVLSVHVIMSASFVLVSAVGMVGVGFVDVCGIHGGEELDVFLVVARLWEEEFEAVRVCSVEVVAVQALGSNETEIAVQGEGTRVRHFSFENHLRMGWDGMSGMGWQEEKDHKVNKLKMNDG